MAVQADDILLSIEDLHTYFFVDGNVAKSVRGVDLSLGRGQTLGLVGESGSGKSVTAQSILRLIQQPAGRIVQGRIVFEGTDLASIAEEEMRRIRGNSISMIFQEPMTSLNPVIRIGEQIAEVVRLHRGLPAREALDYATDMLAKVGIAEPARRIAQFPHELSGGMRQRVMIAIALSCAPRMLIADEPTTALDVTIQAQILDLMRSLQRESGISILLITHDLGVVAEMAHRVAVMYAGQIVEHADVATLFERPLHPYTEGLLASVPGLDRAPTPDRMLPAIAGTVPNVLDLPPGCAFQDRCPKVHDRCRREEPPLATVELRHDARCWLHVV
ncbi:MAG: peptide ABC transporter ATP-binding protein [Alphaproteobacteria bacterium 65-37]|nr:ABC transporter ATP-binding protein [Alphaproteobacteria bacterium]OJU39825.1 MAG: peptide ABC transporter ATP-binding protein [Alphaproteobacteria bacterium 65-37]